MVFVVLLVAGQGDFFGSCGRGTFAIMLSKEEIAFIQYWEANRLRRKKPDPKLYSFESVVDRGFEDVLERFNALMNAPADGRDFMMPSGTRPARALTP